MLVKNLLSNIYIETQACGTEWNETGRGEVRRDETRLDKASSGMERSREVRTGQEEKEEEKEERQ